jgi:ATP-binding cassette subfamily F protein uup
MLDRLTDSLLVFDGAGGVRGFAGNYEDYLAFAAGGPGTAESPPREEYRPAHAEKSGLSFKERKEYGELLAEIERLEKEQKSLESAFQEQPIDPIERGRNSRRYQEILGMIEQRMARWEELAGRTGD